ncbi:aldolase [Methylomonas lenta]|uniref:Aldolase n=1 Tax=Methylomonas lenta TaxID=980561 RepID=A0A177N8Y5_9GAMM|nr:class II aldolase/adducin family protein [Methylomonas lenta]OAI14355.1 aldolase [Methylomonas lenta]
MNSDNELEGVIKYHLDHHPSELSHAVDISQINAWRSLLLRLKLIGQSVEKYNGLGYGNISQRLLFGKPGFLISGTQTGHLSQLTPEHFAIVESASPKRNSIISSGPSQPSSEALTHASVYLHDNRANAVIHVHSPELWRNTQTLGLPHTCAEIAYGSVEMAEAVAELFASGQLKPLPLFSMLGHEDGIVAFADSLPSAATILITQLAKALAIEQTAFAG